MASTLWRGGGVKVFALSPYNLNLFQAFSNLNKNTLVVQMPYLYYFSV